MRITCPNCDAQYEVDDRAIPDTGRDVQCSNCGHAWFQLPPQDEAALEDEAATFGEAAPAAVPAPEPTPEPAAAAPEAAPPDAAPPEVAPPGFAPGVEPEFEPEPDAEEAARLTPAPQRRPLDENIQAVLREEAERERRAREAEGGPAEAPAAPGPAPQSATTVVQPAPKGFYDFDEDAAEGEAAEDAPAEHPARRDLLPDIEQINSTLRAGSSPVADQGAAAVAVAPPQARADRSRGFRSGFRLVLLLVIIGLVVYVLAPGLSDSVPALAKPLQAYVAMVNGYRDWIDHLLLRAVAGLKGG